MRRPDNEPRTIRNRSGRGVTTACGQQARLERRRLRRQRRVRMARTLAARAQQPKQRMVRRIAVDAIMRYFLDKSQKVPEKEGAGES